MGRWKVNINQKGVVACVAITLLGSHCYTIRYADYGERFLVSGQVLDEYGKAIQDVCVLFIHVDENNYCHIELVAMTDQDGNFSADFGHRWGVAIPITNMKRGRSYDGRGGKQELRIELHKLGYSRDLSRFEWSDLESKDGAVIVDLQKVLLKKERVEAVMSQESP